MSSRGNPGRWLSSACAGAGLAQRMHGLGSRRVRACRLVTMALRRKVGGQGELRRGQVFYGCQRSKPSPSESIEKGSRLSDIGDPCQTARRENTKSCSGAGGEYCGCCGCCGPGPVVAELQCWLQAVSGVSDGRETGCSDELITEPWDTGRVPEESGGASQTSRLFSAEPAGRLVLFCCRLAMTGSFACGSGWGCAAGALARPPAGWPVTPAP